MKKIIFTFLAVVLSVFALNAEYGSSNRNDSITTDSITEETDPVKASLDTIQGQISSALKKMDNIKTMFGQDVDKLNIEIAVLSIGIAIFSLFVAYISYKYTKLGYEASQKTADNVLRTSFIVQKGQFDDLIRHLYRNLVCTLAFIQRIMENRDPEQVEDRKPFRNNSDFKGQKQGQAVSKKTKEQLQKQKDKYFSAYRQPERQNKETSQPEPKETKPQKYQYPSEEHLLKLKVLPEDVLHLESYNQDDKIYQKMHELKLQLRNYDIEIDTAMTHLKENVQDEAMIRENLDTLTFKPLFLISKIVGVVKSLDKKEAKKLKGKNIDEYQNAASIMTRSHVGNLIEHKESFRINEYLDLNLQLPLEKTGKADVDKEATRVKKPYNGFGRAYNLFFKEVIDADVKKNKPDEGHADKTTEDKNEDSIKDYVTHSERFKDKKPDDYKDAIEAICGKDEVKPNDKESTKKLKRFRKSIITKEEDKEAKGDFPFKEHFLTMLSIDVTIELSKIHMIDINKPT